MHNDDSASAAQRVIEHEYTRNLPTLLQHLNVSLLISTYQADKLVVVGSHGDALDLSYHNVERAMGVAVRPESIAIAAHRSIVQLAAAPALCAQLEQKPDACFVARSAHFTGDIQTHELAWQGDRLWLVNTLFSCLCTLDSSYSFVPQWHPPFISALVAEDRCHLNGVALAEGSGVPRYVTFLGESDAPLGWRSQRENGGVVFDLQANQSFVRGLAMPHSPRLHDKWLYVLDSGTGRLLRIASPSGAIEPILELPGFPRGLALTAQVGFVGLSKIRESATFSTLPIANRRDELWCGVSIVDLARREQIGWLRFHGGIDEIFDVQLIPAVQRPLVRGPYPDIDGHPTLWTAPPTSTTSG